MKIQTHTYMQAHDVHKYGVNTLKRIIQDIHFKDL